MPRQFEQDLFHKTFNRWRLHSTSFVSSSSSSLFQEKKEKSCVLFLTCFWPWPASVFFFKGLFLGKKKFWNPDKKKKSRPKLLVASSSRHLFYFLFHVSDEDETWIWGQFRESKVRVKFLLAEFLRTLIDTFSLFSLGVYSAQLHSNCFLKTWE